MLIVFRNYCVKCNVGRLVEAGIWRCCMHSWGRLGGVRTLVMLGKNSPLHHDAACKEQYEVLPNAFVSSLGYCPKLVIFPCWLDVIYQPRSSMCETRISVGLMINAGMLLASSRRLIFGGPVIALGLTGMSLSAVK